MTLLVELCHNIAIEEVIIFEQAFQCEPVCSVQIKHNCTKKYKVGRDGLKPNLATSYRPFKPSEANNAPFHMWEMKILNEGKKPNENKQKLSLLSLT